MGNSEIINLHQGKLQALCEFSCVERLFVLQIEEWKGEDKQGILEHKLCQRKFGC